MKTKNKAVVLVQIAIVLCSVFLVALPAIAAEQNQEMQKTSASEVTAASEMYEPGPLDVYGNANEDDTIDMRDLTYVKLIFFGKKPETELADAKYDGKINPLDFIQIKLIIVGKEKELTIIDGDGEPVTVSKPVERIIVLYKCEPELLRILNAGDKIVGVSEYIKQYDYILFPEIGKLPSVGSFHRPDYEAVLNLNPDVLLAQTGGSGTAEMQEKLPGVTVIFLGQYFPDLLNLEQSRFRAGVKKLGYLLDKEEEAEEFTNWRDGWINKIKSRTEGLSEDEKPLVINSRYSGPTWDYRIYCSGYKTYQMTVLAGGKDVSENLEECGYAATVDPEWILEQNPDIFVVQAYYERTDHGYNTDDPSEMAATREDIVNIPVLANVNAVKNGDVYMIAGNFRNGGDGNIIGTAYMAKWFHPELFEDLDPRAIHQEYLDEFQHFDFNVYEHGVFTYPPLED